MSARSGKGFYARQIDRLGPALREEGVVNVREWMNAVREANGDSWDVNEMMKDDVRAQDAVTALLERATGLCICSRCSYKGLTVTHPGVERPVLSPGLASRTLRCNITLQVYGANRCSI